MQCVHCGAELSDREEICTLCGKLAKVADAKVDLPMRDAETLPPDEPEAPDAVAEPSPGETTAFCPECKQYEYLDANGYCSRGHKVSVGAAQGDQARNHPPVPPGTYPGDIPVDNFLPNTSGQGIASYPPPQVSGLNWGAFLLTWIWGVGNSVWISLLCFVPVVSYVMPFVLLFKGNEWAWRNKRWDSVEQFLDVQRKWMIAGIALYVIGICFACAGIFFAIMAGSVSQNGTVSPG